MTKLSTISLNNHYVMSIEILAELPPTQEQQNQNNQQMVQEVANRLGKITLSSMKAMVSTDTLASKILSGFQCYQSATVWDLQNYLSPNNYGHILGTLTNAFANKARENMAIEQTKNYETLDIVIKESDFTEFVVQESIGLTLPMYKLSFTIHDKTLLKYINTSSKLRLSFGQTEKSLTQFNCNVFKVIPQDLGNKINLILYGYLDSPKYLTTSERISYQGTSLSVLNQCLQNYNLKLVTNIDKTDDSMTWIMSNHRPIEYFINLWKHAFIDEKQQIFTSITTEGNFNFINIQKKKEEELKNLQLESKLFFKQNSFYANFGSMARSRFVFDLNTKGITRLLLNDTSGLQKTKVDPKLSGVRTSRYGILTPEMHKNWYVAEMLNPSKLYSCINTNAWVNIFQPWNYFNVTDVINAHSVYSEDAGIYVVVGKLLSINSTRDLNTYIQLGRETYSKSTGNFNA